MGRNLSINNSRNKIRTFQKSLHDKRLKIGEAEVITILSINHKILFLPKLILFLNANLAHIAFKLFKFTSNYMVFAPFLTFYAH